MTSFRALQWWIFSGVIVLDQAVKLVLRTRLVLYKSETVIPGIVDLTRVHNYGTAFGFMNGVDFPYKTLVVTVMQATALAALAYVGSTLGPEHRISRVGLAMTLGGAVGNLIDRVTAGYVLDFVDVYFGSWHFWAFNVADSAITVGMILILLDLLGLGRYFVSRAV